MFDIGATELLLVAVVAILVIGPKDMPLALRTAGRWVGKMRKMSAHFRAGVDNIVREAELEDMEKKWQAQNEKIMREHPEGVPDQMEPTGAYPGKPQAPGQPQPHPVQRDANGKPLPPPKTPEEQAENLRLIAEKRQAAAEEAEQLAKHAAAEARLASSEAAQAAQATKAAPATDGAEAAKGD